MVEQAGQTPHQPQTTPAWQKGSGTLGTVRASATSGQLPTPYLAAVQRQIIGAQSAVVASSGLVSLTWTPGRCSFPPSTDSHLNWVLEGKSSPHLLGEADSCNSNNNKDDNNKTITTTTTNKKIQVRQSKVLASTQSSFCSLPSWLPGAERALQGTWRIKSRPKKKDILF